MNDLKTNPVKYAIDKINKEVRVLNSLIAHEEQVTAAEHAGQVRAAEHAEQVRAAEHAEQLRARAHEQTRGDGGGGGGILLCCITAGFLNWHVAAVITCCVGLCCLASNNNQVRDNHHQGREDVPRLKNERDTLLQLIEALEASLVADPQSSVQSYQSYQNGFFQAHPFNSPSQMADETRNSINCFLLNTNIIKTRPNLQALVNAIDSVHSVVPVAEEVSSVVTNEYSPLNESSPLIVTLKEPTAPPSESSNGL